MNHRTLEPPTTARWWSEPGPEVCPHCLRAHYAEVGYVCADCGEDVCALCAVVVREGDVVLCPRCAEER